MRRSSEKPSPRASSAGGGVVTEVGRSLILEHSSLGRTEVLLKLSKGAAKKLAEHVERVHGQRIRAYHHKW